MVCFAVLALAVLPEAGVTLRLNLHPGQVLKVAFRVERFQPDTWAEFQETVTIPTRLNGITTTKITFDRLTIDGKDQTKALRAMLDDPSGTFGWTELSKRSGGMTSPTFRRMDPMIAPFFGECGIYLADFPRQSVTVGDSWYGSTTATGGCTSAKYTLRGLRVEKGRRLADLDVTDIAMANHHQVGPMKMVVDVGYGIPTLVDYRVKNKQSGRESRISQRLVAAFS